MLPGEDADGPQNGSSHRLPRLFCSEFYSRIMKNWQSRKADTVLPVANLCDVSANGHRAQASTHPHSVSASFRAR
jgi:hypothetical protein